MGKDQIRRLLEVCTLKPYLATRKYIFVWLPETMNAAALNALLKTLEDPPTRTHFIFVTHALHLILPTLLSRLHTVSVRAFAQEEVAELLIAKGIEAKKADQLAFACDGVMRTALLDAFSAEEVVQEALFYDWWRGCWMGQYQKIVPIVRHFYDLDKAQRAAWLQHALKIVHLCVLSGTGVEVSAGLSNEAARFVEGLSKVVGGQRMEALYHSFNEALTQLEQHAEPRLLFLRLSIRLCHFFARIKLIKP